MSSVDTSNTVMTQMIINRQMAQKLGISHQALRKHVRRGIVRDDVDGRFYSESAERVRRELAQNRLMKWRHCT
jgi:DNA-binding CsgD family transcriptional regulator